MDTWGALVGRVFLLGLRFALIVVGGFAQARRTGRRLLRLRRRTRGRERRLHHRLRAPQPPLCWHATDYLVLFMLCPSHATYSGPLYCASLATRLR